MSRTDAFFDTNVLLYLLSGDTAKADRAETILAQGGTISVQVLNEFTAVAVRKLKMTYPEIREILQAVRSICRTEALTPETHDVGLQLAERYGLSVYDAMIAASALNAGCAVLYTEDLQDGQILEGSLKIANPFAS